MLSALTQAATVAVNWAVNPRPEHDPDDLAAAVRGKNVLVTGASYGVGAATARLLAEAGATVLLAARTEDRLATVAEEITATGGTAYCYPANLADPVAAEALAGTILAEHGHVDIVVSNAGKSIRRSVELQYDRFHDFERTIGVNYLGPVRMLLALLPSMRARGQGQIINVSTVGVRLTPAPRWGAYQASKGAFDTWLRGIAPEIAADGVAVSTFYPSVIHTRMSAPTPALRQLPGLSSGEAAGVVARAIVTRERAIGPWWLGPAELGSVLLAGPVSWALGVLYRNSDDTASANGDATTDASHTNAER